MTARYLKTFGAIAAVAFAAGSLVVPSVAAAVDFSGKKIKIIVPFGEGGATTC